MLLICHASMVNGRCAGNDLRKQPPSLGASVQHRRRPLGERETVNQGGKLERDRFVQADE